MNKILIICALLMVACTKPRVNVDIAQFGDNAYVTRVRVFKLTGTQEKLEEYYRTGVLTPAIQQVFVDNATVVDNNAATAVTTVPAATDMTNVGIVFNHRAQKIEPVDGAPVAGHLADFSKATYKYRLISGDGTIRVWTLTFVKQ